MSVTLRVQSHTFSGRHYATVIRCDSDAPIGALSRQSRVSESAALRGLGGLLADLHASAIRRADALEQEGR